MEDRVLADALSKKAILSPELSQKLLIEAKETRKRFEDIVYGRRLADEAAVAGVKSEILGIPFQKVKIDSISDQVIKMIPYETATTYKAVPIGKQDNMLVVGMLNPDDPRAQEALRFIAKSQKISLGVYIITPTDLELVMRRYSSYQTDLDMAIKGIRIQPGKGLSGTQRVVAIEEGGSVLDEAPIIKIVSSTLQNAVAQGASDVHIEPQRTRLRIRLRIDGNLNEVASLPLELHQPIISRIKILSDLKIDETRIPQDGRFRTVIFGRDIDYRVSTFPTPMGEKVAIRVLDPSVGLKGLGNLGLLEYTVGIIKAAIERPYGMILVTGPTGSGKTTTLYALMQILNKESVNILSLEDPVEYFMEGLNQSQMHPEIGYDFSSGLRQTLRQDPDIIMVGEIRDAETAKLAVQAALTGHIVLSTLHTNSTIGVVPRLIDMDVDSFLLPSALNMMISQRLVPQICGSCKKGVVPLPEVAKIIKEELGKVSPDILAKFNLKEPYMVYESKGCGVCKGKGVVGRIAIVETLLMTRELGDIVSENVTEGKILEEAKRQKVVTMRQDGIVKALMGTVSIQEVLRETSSL